MLELISFCVQGDKALNNKKNKKQRLSNNIDILFLLIIISITGFAVYTYNQLYLNWYQFTIAAIIVCFFDFLLFRSFPLEGYKDNFTSVDYLNCIVLSMASFFIKPLNHRLILWFLLIVFSETFLKPMKNHDNDHFTRTEQAKVSIHGFFLASFIFFAVKTSGFSRWVNVIFAFIAALLSNQNQETITGIKNYDEEEDQYNASTFKAATHKSFDAVMRDKGLRAEYASATWVDDIESHYKILHSVFTPPNRKGEISEIDHIVISRAGIDLLEVKNKSQYWEISGEGYDDAVAFDQYGNLLSGHQDNPFSQNRSHMKNLELYLNKASTRYPLIKDVSSYIGGYVVFGASTVGWEIHNVKQGCANYDGIGKLLNKSCKEHNYLSNEQIDLIYNILKPLQNNPKLKAAHRAKHNY